MLTITNLHDLSYNELINLYHTCQESYKKERLHSIILCLDGYTYSEIARLIKRDEETVRKWIHNFNKNGISGLERKSPPGRPMKLDYTHKNWLKKCIEEGPRTYNYNFSNWDTKSLAYHLFRTYGIELSRERIRQILHKIKCRIIRPWYKYIKADPEDQQKAREEIQDLLHNLPEDTVVLFIDEMSAKQHPTLIGQWAVQGERPQVFTLGNHARVNVFGAVNPLTGKTHYRLLKNQKSESLQEFLEHLLSYYPETLKLIIFLDNFSSHRAKIITEFIENHKDRIELRFLPKYSPKLNPMERIWKWLRRRVTHNYFFEKIDLLKEAIRNAFCYLQTFKEQVFSLIASIF